jgi:hypothetical protein
MEKESFPKFMANTGSSLQGQVQMCVAEALEGKEGIGEWRLTILRNKEVGAHSQATLTP